MCGKYNQWGSPLFIKNITAFGCQKSSFNNELFKVLRKLSLRFHADFH